MIHKDYFGNPIEIGDIVLRNNNSGFNLTKVVRVGKKTIGLERLSYQSVYHGWNKNTRQYEKVINNKPLYVRYFSGINLSKLDNQKVQETIQKYINEI